jgi:hypothetical protein
MLKESDQSGMRKEIDEWIRFLGEHNVLVLLFQHSPVLLVVFSFVICSWTGVKKRLTLELMIRSKVFRQ